MIPPIIAAVAVTVFKKIIKLSSDLLSGAMALSIALLFIGIEILIHLMVWTGLSLAFFLVTGVEFREWNRIMPFTYYYNDANVAVPIALGGLIVIILTISMYSWLALKRAKDKVMTIYVFMFIFDMLAAYAYICICVAYKMFLALGFSFNRWSYLYVPAFVIAVHVLFIVSVYAYNELKNYFATHRLTL